MLVRGLATALLAVVLRGLIDTVVAHRQASSDGLSDLLPWLAAGLVIGVVEGVAPLLSSYLRRHLTDRMSVDLSGRVMAEAARLDLASIENAEMRDVLDRARRDPAGALRGLVKNLETAGVEGSRIVLLAAILLAVDPFILLALLPAAAAYYRVQLRAAERKRAEYVARTQKTRWTRYYISLLTQAHSAMELRLLGLGPLFVRRFTALMNEFVTRDRALYRGDLRGGSIYATLSSIGFYGVLGHAALLATRGEITIGSLVMFAAVGARLRATLEQFVVGLTELHGGALRLGDTRSFLERRQVSAAAPAGVRGEAGAGLTVTDLQFTYPGAQNAVLRGVTFEIRPGRTVALTGANGSGKTTIAKLVAGLYAPTSGSISLGGRPLMSWSEEELAERVAFVQQRAVRFEATAAENIAFGDWPRLGGPAGAHRDDVREAVRGSVAEGVIDHLPEGLETLLGRLFGRHDLSGGEWRRLAITRILARTGDLLILDEPCAHFDPAAEREFVERFPSVAKGRATLLISHRPTTLRLADQVLVVDEGRIEREVRIAELEMGEAAQSNC